MRFLFLLTVGLLSFQTINAQLSQVIHQTFDIDEATSISLNLVGEYEIEKWPGNTIMTETSVQIYDATPSILKHFISAGRYEILGESTDDSYGLTAKDSERKAIQTRRGDCYEFIKMRVFVPEDFDVVDQKNLVRVIEEEVSTNN